ncbi:uncharacterized protein DNG_03231 [Cephalotrichum gorgonifer]|uniref:Uncharacterized protein n=1 Tax=Cephalotrichum gorgonifer TaxID=2041049 RepID=A0AAE8MTW0_9PEZI|nr:uncharacterized protein DNG_03231 [Cephalotrichum gorgonifer]
MAVEEALRTHFRFAASHHFEYYRFGQPVVDYKEFFVNFQTSRI